MPVPGAIALPVNLSNNEGRRCLGLLLSLWEGRDSSKEVNVGICSYDLKLVCLSFVGPGSLSILSPRLVSIAGCGVGRIWRWGRTS